MHLEAKMAPAPTKKLLALDGGGIRGMISLEILAAIEKRVGRKLCDYFDYVAGTSTGAIIATCLSLGMTVKEIGDFYQASGPDMFAKAGILKRFRYKFEDDRLAAKLKAVFRGKAVPGNDVQPGKFDSPDGDVKLGSAALKTLLMVVLRNATTDSPWPLSNNPRAKYNDREDSNLDIPLWQIVRASTAAPTYFPPELVNVGAKEFLFVDGGVTMYNNPAFLLFLMATLPVYRLGWEPGPEKLLIVSVGTGASAAANENLEPGQMNLLYHAASVPSALMFAALNEQDMLCRVFGRCLHGDVIDREVGDLKWVPENGATGLPKLFTYLRYSADLSREGLNHLELPDVDPRHVQQLDSVEHISELRKVGQAVARKVSADHFAGFLA
jgi:hypothetical protein